MPTKPLASAINGQSHITVLADIIADRLNGLHGSVSENRIYMIGSVRAAALYFLAQQFDVLGYRGWFLADTEEKRRDLIRRAIELHRFKGTPWAVKEAIKSLGFQEVTIIERVGLNDGYYNGVFNYDGSHTYGDSGIGEWATFKVIISLEGITTPLTSELITALIALINEYKNVRSHLVELTFSMSDTDDLTMEDVSDYGNFIEFTDQLTGMTLTYDGTASYDGEYDYDHTGDSLQVTVAEPPGPEVMTLVFGSNPSTNLVAFNINGDISIDWGDGTVEDYTGYNEITHTYASTGERTVLISSLSCYSLNVPSISGVHQQLIEITNVFSFIGSIFIQGYGGDTIDISGCSVLENVTITAAIDSYAGELKSISLPEVIPTYSINLEYNELTESAVNETLILMNTLIGFGEGGSVLLQGQTPPALPSGDGITALIELLDKGVTLTYDS